MSLLLKTFYILWIVGTPIVFIGVSIWAFLNRNYTKGDKKIAFFQTKLFKAINLFIASLFVCFMVWNSLLFISDIYCLLTGRYETVEGTPQKLWRHSKDFSEYIQINGRVVQFPFTSSMEMGKHYKVNYLPNTNYGFEVEEIRESYQ